MFCNGHTYRSIICPDTGIYFCIDCAGTCDSSCPYMGTWQYTNPCRVCRSRTAVYSIFNIDYRVITLYPQIDMSSIVMTASKTSITVSLNISKAGTAYCAVYPRALAFNVSSPVLIQTQGSATVVRGSGGGSAMMTVSGLYPSTKYDVYCAAADSSGANLTPLSVVWNTFQLVTTLCCKSISLTSAPSKILASTQNSQFGFQLTAPPSISTKVLLSATKYSPCLYTVAGITPSISVSPTIINFDPTSTLSASYGVYATAGCYNIVLHPAARGDSSFKNVSFVVTAVQSVSSLPSPLLSSAMFSPDGISLVVTFGVDTDRGSSVISSYYANFNCSYLFNFYQRQGVIYNAVCIWNSNSQVTARFVTGLVPGDVISVQKNTVRRAGCTSSCAYTPYTQTMAIQIPSSAIAPSVSLSAPPVLSSCDDLVLDPTSSLGNGGRSWSFIAWSVSSGSSNVFANQTAPIASYLNSNYNDTSTSVSIPNSMLHSGTYVITLLLTNFMSKSSQTSVSVELVDYVRYPRLSIASPTSLALYRSQPLTLVATGSFPSCVSGIAAYTFIYSWGVYLNGLKFIPLRSRSNDMRAFSVPAYSLNVSSSYTIQVTLQTVGHYTKTFTRTSVVVVVGTAGVQAAISGASSPTVSTSGTLVLDATGSQDLDYPENKALLTFSWACSMYSSSYGSTCPGFSLSTSSGGEILTVAANTLSAATYNFSVSVSNSAGSSSTAYVIVTYLATPLPSISIQNPATKYNPGDRVSLFGTIQTTSGQRAFAQWTPSISLDSSIYVANTAATIPASTTFSFQLTIKPNSLAAGGSYVFQLQAAYYTSSLSTQLSSSKASGQVTILMNSPPFGGYLAVKPTVGYALNTSYFFSSNSWVDDSTDYPLSYAMAYYSTDSTKLNYVKTVNVISSVYASLGQGLPVKNYTQTCVVIVTDSFGCSANASKSVQVLPLKRTASLASSVSMLLTTAVFSGQVESVYQIGNAVTSILNSVTCNVPRNCSSLHREDCTTVANTCGRCLSGYIGIDGFSNSLCSKFDVSISSSTAVSLSGTSAYGVVGSTCTSNAFCLTGACSGGICVDSPKACSNNCSWPAGVCTYYDYNNIQTSATCAESDNYCRAVCVCNSTQFGSDCSLSEAEFESVKSTRSLLCSSLLAVVDSQDADANVLASRANAVANIFTDMTQISKDGISDCTSVLFHSAEQLSQLSSSSTTTPVTSLLSSFSSLISSGVMLLPAVVTNMTTSMQYMATELSQQLVVGESSLQLITDSIRLSVVKPAASNMTTTAFKPPQTTYELLSEDVVPYIQVPTMKVDSTAISNGDVAIVLIEYLTNIINDTVANTSVVSLQVASSSMMSLQLELDNLKPISYVDHVSANLTVNCTWSVEPYSMTLECPDGKEIDFECPGTLGQFTVRCADYLQRPQCNFWNALTLEPLTGCYPTAYSASSTTCVCNNVSSGYSSSGRRSLASSSSTNSFTFSSSRVIKAVPATAKFFKDRFPLKVLPTNLQTTLISAGLIGLILLGLLIFPVVDKVGLPAQQDVENKRRLLSTRGFFNSVLPEEYSGEWWFTRLCKQCLLDHDWICVFGLHRYPRASRTIKWVILAGRISIYLLLNSVLASELYGNNNQCPKLTSQYQCEHSVSRKFGMEDTCVWDYFYHSCNANMGLVHNPMSTLIILTMVFILAVPVEVSVAAMSQYVEPLLLEFLVQPDPVAAKRMGNKMKLSKVAVMPDSIDENDDNLIDKNLRGSNKLPGEKSTKIVKSSKNPDAKSVKEGEAVASVILSEAVTVEEDIGIELNEFKTLPSTLYRAAKLSKLQQDIDAHTLHEESRTVVQAANPFHAIITEKFKPCNSSQLLTYLWMETTTTQTPVDLAVLGGPEREELTNAVLLKVRHDADMIAERISKFSCEHDKEAYLLKQFLIHSQPRMVRRIIGYCFRDTHSHRLTQFKEESEQYPATFGQTFGRYVCFALLIAYFAISATYTLLLCSGLGFNAIAQWCVCLFVSMGIDAVFLTPFKIYLRSVLLTSYGSEALRTIHGIFRERAKALLHRQRSPIAGPHPLIQHFNPACRAARKQPQLAMSRILMSLTDYDLPAHILSPHTTETGHAEGARTDKLYNPLYWIFFSLEHLPAEALWMVLNWIAVVVFCFLMIALLTAYNQQGPYALIGIMLGLAAVAFSVDRYYRNLNRYRRVSRALHPVRYASDLVKLAEDDELLEARVEGRFKKKPEVMRSSMKDRSDSFVQRVLMQRLHDTDPGNSIIPHRMRSKFGYRRSWFWLREMGYIVKGKSAWLSGVELLNRNQKISPFDTNISDRNLAGVSSIKRSNSFDREINDDEVLRDIGIFRSSYDDTLFFSSPNKGASPGAGAANDASVTKKSTRAQADADMQFRKITTLPKPRMRSSRSGIKVGAALSGRPSSPSSASASASAKEIDDIPEFTAPLPWAPRRTRQRSLDNLFDNPLHFDDDDEDYVEIIHTGNNNKSGTHVSVKEFVDDDVSVLSMMETDLGLRDTLIFPYTGRARTTNNAQQHLGSSGSVGSLGSISSLGNAGSVVHNVVGASSQTRRNEADELLFFATGSEDGKIDHGFLDALGKAEAKDEVLWEIFDNL
jgi:hypothetical protein